MSTSDARDQHHAYAETCSNKVKQGLNQRLHSHSQGGGTKVSTSDAQISTMPMPRSAAKSEPGISNQGLGSRNFFFFIVPGCSHFQLSGLAGLGYELKFSVVFTIIVSITQTLTLTTTQILP